MSKSNKLIEDEFFVIDSNNLKDINQKLYGYIIQDETIIFDSEVDVNNLNENGSYIYVDVNDSEIKILQDFNGCYGLYLYKSEDYFAISNSFLKLVEYLKDKHPISFNKDYADAFICARLYSFSYCETLINEIEVLPKNYKIIINKKDKSINFEEIDYGEHTIDLDSKEGFKILDNWYYKWINIIRSLKEKTNNLSIQLSGGFDSRIIAALFLSSNIDLNKINIFSYNDKKHCHESDYKIASENGEKFNFTLNKNVFSVDLETIDIKTQIDISFYTKLGFHKEMYFKPFKFSKPVYSINGFGGECIRGIYGTEFSKSSAGFIDMIKRKAEQHHFSLVHPSEKIAESSLNRLSKKFPSISAEDLPNKLYREVTCRNHAGKASVESYLRNVISLAPSFDSELHKIKLTTEECNDKNLIMTVILLRYCPKLLNFPIEGNREIKDETIEYAKKLNKKYRFIKIKDKLISGPNISEIVETETLKNNEADELLKKAFYSKQFEMEFKKYYPSELYDKISDVVETKDYYPLTEVYSSIGILKIQEYVKANNLMRYNIENWIDEILNEDEEENKRLKIITKQLLSKYNTGRIDIKNLGDKNNSIEILDTSDSLINITSPEWFNDEKGKGIIIHSEENNLDLKIKCIKDGTLNITLRSQDIRDKENNKFPIYIDYTSLKINNKEQLTQNKLICHDEPFKIEKDVTDGETITIHINWKPFNPSNIYKNKKLLNLEKEVENLTTIQQDLKEKNKNLKEKNKNLKEKNQEILNSNSWKITKPLRQAKKIIK